MDIQHIDTCLPCYLQDHCNGGNAQLLCVAVDSAMRMHHVLAELIQEIEHNGDKIPEGRDAEAVAAARELFKGVHPFRVFDPYCGRGDEYDDMCYAYFRLTWKDV